jgi:hypothetical protein
MWCWRKIEEILWTSRVRNKEVHRVKEERNTLHTIKKRKANWIDHIICRKYFLIHIFEEIVKERIDRKTSERT